MGGTREAEALFHLEATEAQALFLIGQLYTAHQLINIHIVTIYKIIILVLTTSKLVYKFINFLLIIIVVTLFSPHNLFAQNAG
jgi:hypothetical protein